MKKLLIIILSLIITIVTYSANIYSISDGNFSSTTIWSNIPGGSTCNCKPSSNNSDQVFVRHNVILDADYSVKNSISIDNGGKLKTDLSLKKSITINTNAYLYVYDTLVVWDLEFSNGSYVYVSTGGVIIVLNNLTNKNNSNNVVINGDVTVVGTFDNGNGGVVTGDGSITANDYTGVGSTFGHEPTNDIPDGEIVTSDPLPITLYNFYVICDENNCTMRIFWETLSEINSDRFELYRSYNAYNYELIYIQQSIGTPTNGESYVIDDGVTHIGNTYYKLIQIDFDGNYEVFNSISIFCDMIIEINLYPNPLKEGKILSYTGDVYSIMIYDIVGREIRVEIKNNEIIGLSKGIYIVRINGKLQIKIIVE